MYTTIASYLYIDSMREGVGVMVHERKGEGKWGGGCPICKNDESHEIRVKEPTTGRHTDTPAAYCTVAADVPFALYWLMMRVS